MPTVEWQDSRWQGKPGSMLFEQLCFDLLHKMGFRELKWIGRSPGDQGRDIDATLDVSDPLEGKRAERWLVECKLSRSGISVSSLTKTISWCDVHKPDVLLVMTNSSVTLQTRQWLHSISPDKRYRIRCLEGARLEQLIQQHGSIYHKYWERPKAFFNKAVLHLVDSDPEAREEGVKLFTLSEDKDDIVRTVAHVAAEDGVGRANAAESLYLLCLRWRGTHHGRSLAALLPKLRKAEDLEDDVFSSKPGVAARYDEAVTKLESALESDEESLKEQADDPSEKGVDEPSDDCPDTP